MPPSAGKVPTCQQPANLAQPKDWKLAGHQRQPNNKSADLMGSCVGLFLGWKQFPGNQQRFQQVTDPLKQWSDT